MYFVFFQCARMVQKFFQEKELMAQKAVKSRELQLKRIASCMAKEIKIFWTNVEKVYINYCSNMMHVII